MIVIADTSPLDYLILIELVWRRNRDAGSYTRQNGWTCSRTGEGLRWR
jgi:hypothetical protein